MSTEINPGIIIAAVSVTVTLVSVIFAASLGLRFLRTWQARVERTENLEFEKLNLEKVRLEQERMSGPERSSIHINNSGSAEVPDGSDNGGFSFFDVDEPKKRMFVDALTGFEDYARLKGYNVNVHINTATTNKVGMKIVINDEGITVSKEKVKNDARDFVRKIMTDDDFSDIPMVDDPDQHSAIVTALTMRHALLKQRASISAESAAAYRELLSEVREFTKAAISYVKPEPASYFQIEASGGSIVRDQYKNTNSPGAIQGRGNTSVGNSINVGSTATEKATRAKGLGELVAAVRESAISTEKKDDIVRYLSNAKEEIDGAGEVNNDNVAKWLGRAKSLIELGGATPALIEGAKKVFDMFGDSSTWPSVTI